MPFVILKTDDEIVSVKNATLLTQNNYWIIPNIANPTERVTNEMLKMAQTAEEREDLYKYTRLLIKDTQDTDILYKIELTLFQEHRVYISTRVFDKGKYLCFLGYHVSLHDVFSFSAHKKELYDLIEVCRKYPD